MAEFVRTDKRAADELRPVRLTPNFIPTAEGSVLIEVGATRVICTASVEEGVPTFQKGTGRGWVTGEYSMLPRATGRRTPRDSARGRVAGRSQEIQRLIGRSLRAVTRLDALGERSVILDCDVIQADGGTRTAAITGAYVALALACQKLVELRILRALPLTDSVAATSVGLVEGAPLLDLTYEEDSRAQVDMNVVSTGSGRLVEVQATGEAATFTREDFDRLLALAQRGLRQLVDKQQEVVPLNLARP
jgi:ribonuclease PH